MRVQWRGDNLDEIEQMLSGHITRIEPTAQKELHILGLGGVEAIVDLGDFVHFRGDSLGIERAGHNGDEPQLVWTGDNVQQISDFVAQWDTDIEVTGSQLKIGGQEPVILNRGDKLLRRGQYLFVSRAGDHRT